MGSRGTVRVLSHGLCFLKLTVNLFAISDGLVSEARFSGAMGNKTGRDGQGLRRH